MTENAKVHWEFDLVVWLPGDDGLVEIPGWSDTPPEMSQQDVERLAWDAVRRERPELAKAALADFIVRSRH